MYNKRKINFGKYKGENIDYLILTHIGYIMWCLENLRWFKLNKEEQELYDAISIAIKKYELNTTFPIDLMLKHVSNTDKLENLDTPFIFKNRTFSFLRKNIGNPLCQMISEYITGIESYKEQNNSLSNLDGLQHCFNKDCRTSYYEGNTMDETYPSQNELFNF